MECLIVWGLAIIVSLVLVKNGYNENVETYVHAVPWRSDLSNVMVNWTQEYTSISYNHLYFAYPTISGESVGFYSFGNATMSL